VWLWVWVWNLWMWVYAGVCVCEREREKKRERKIECGFICEREQMCVSVCLLCEYVSIDLHVCVSDNVYL
jgi:hypothetical protein